MSRFTNSPINQSYTGLLCDFALGHTCTAPNVLDPATGLQDRGTVRCKCRLIGQHLHLRAVQVLAHWSRDERGQDLVEWTVGLPVFLILCAGIVFYAWMWWNQVAAAAAVHDGTYLAAIRGGDVGAGYARTQRMLRSAVGGSANSYSISIGADAGRRSVAGSVRNSSVFSLPYLGAMPLNIRAQSFQRLEQFYGGPPAGWW